MCVYLYLKLYTIYTMYAHINKHTHIHTIVHHYSDLNEPTCPASKQLKHPHFMFQNI